MRIRDIPGRLRSLAKPLLWHDGVREAVGRARFLYYARLRDQLRTRDSGHAIERTVSHNLRGLADHRGARMKRLLAPLAAIETIKPDSDVLVIGPRTESDLLLLASLGFSLSRIRGLDLISYSPLVDLGDMHELPYPADRFDVVICGWTSATARPRTSWPRRSRASVATAA
jgi:hypothetical protein